MSEGDTVVGVCCRPPDQEKEVDELGSSLTDPGYPGDFNHPDAVGGTAWLSTPRKLIRRVTF